MLRQTTQDGWRSAWSAASPPLFAYAYSGADANWRKGEGDFHVRDLGLAAASAGLMAARHLRAPGRRVKPGDRQCHDFDFQFLYVFKGALTIETEAGRHRLGLGGAALHGPLLRYNALDFSDDCELIEVTAPATEPAGARPASATGARAEYRDETPSSYAVGAGPRKYFAYRDLGTADFTGRRIHLHVVKALEPMPGGTGWHNHTMSQLFVVLEGWAHLKVEGQGERTMNAGDAMCLGAGMRHDVPAYAANYKVLEMCIPADYETTATAAPSA